MNNNQFGRDERQEEKPPYSRLFVVCSKHLKEDDLKPVFDKFGTVEDLRMPKNRNTGESKGIAYVKYSKTSSAANAIEALHMSTIPISDKPLKVMVAMNKNETQSPDESKYKRIFIKVNKNITEMEIEQHFSCFGQVESVRLQRDRVTDECKGFAYVCFRTFSDAAKAVEKCDTKYKPVFALPYDELKRSRRSLECFSSNSSLIKDNFHNDNSHRDMKRDCLSSMINSEPGDYVMVSVTCHPPVHQKFIEKLLNLIPGVTQFKCVTDGYNSYKAIVTFDSEKAAAFAVERLNQFEFPSGEIIAVKPEYNPLSEAANNLTNIAINLINSMDGQPHLVELANAIAKASTLIKKATSVRDDTEKNDFCSVPLPPIQPLASSNSRVAQRCFIVFKPQPLPKRILEDAFCRFGDLIDVSTFPNKTFGFAKYASARAAQEAMTTLHQATLCGVQLKVLKADERLTKDKNSDNEEEEDSERKRIKLNDKND